MAEESKKIIISVGADTTSAKAEVDKLKDKLGEVGNTVVDKPFKSLKAEIKEATLEAAKLGRQFGTTSEQFTAAARKVAELKNEMDDVNISVQNFNPDNKLRSLVTVASGAIGAVQGVAGAMTLLGVESADAQEAVAKLQALMSLGDSLDRIEDLKDGMKTLGTLIKGNTLFQKANNITTQAAAFITKAFGVAVDSTSKSFKFLKGAIAATGIGLLIVLLGEAVQAFQEFMNAADAAAEAQKKFNEYNLKNASEGLAINKRRLDNEEKIALAGAKNEKESYEIKQKYLKLKGGLETDYFEEVKHLGDEGLEAAQESAQRIKDINVEGTINRINEERRQQKVADDAAKERQSKAEAARKKALDDAKAHAEELKKLKEEELKAIAEIEAETLRSIRDSRLSPREKELSDLQFEFEEKKAKYDKYGKDVTAITQDYNIKRLAVEKKFSDELSNTIAELSLNEFDKQRKAIDEKYDVLLSNAKTTIDQILVETARLEEQGNVDVSQTNRNETINSETNLVNTETANVINDKDTPEQRIQKLQSIYDAEKAFKEAKFQEELAKLGEDQAAIALLTAKHNQELTEDDRKNSEEKKKIAEAEKEAKLSNLSAVGNAVGQLGTLIGQQTVAGKALAVASATIDTYVGANKALAQGGIAGIAAAVAVVATGIVNVKKILSTKVQAKGVSDNASAPAIGTAPTIIASATNSNNTIQDVRVTNQQDQVVQAFISEKDLKNSEDRRNFFNNVSNF